MVIVAILAGFVSNVIYYEANIYDVVSKRKAASQNSRIAVQMMARDLREAMSPDSLFQVSADSIRFDILGDVSVAYEFTGGQILRNGDLLLDSVTNFQFEYYDDTGTLLTFPITDPSKVRSFSIQFSTQNANANINSQISVTPRNF